MTDLEIFAEWHKKSLGKLIITENAQAGAMIEFAKYYHKKQLSLDVVGSNEVELVCDHNWLVKFNSGNFIIGKQCSKCNEYIAY